MKNVHITKMQHRMIVAGGIITVGILQIMLPDQSHLNTVGGITINLVWLLVEPQA